MTQSMARRRLPTAAAGAAGQVGYENRIGKRERDGHNLLFGNTGPEMLMYALHEPPDRFSQDYRHFRRLEVDDSIIFASRQSKFKKVEDVWRDRRNAGIFGRESRPYR